MSYDSNSKFKSRLEEDSFIDWNLVISLVISIIVHLVLFYYVWILILNYFGDSYKQVINALNKRPDIILRLQPGQTEKGEMSFKNFQKFLEGKKDKNKLH
ncbi:MAG: hypothetical protein AB1782_07205 [Cyanobacteriota bacterium]